MTPAPFDLTRFHELLRTQTFGRNLIFEAATASTMDLARGTAERGAAEGTVALADEQTAGRGRLGRSWVTPPRTNLASTLVLRPEPQQLREIAMMAPLAVCDAIHDACGIDADIKWPNDVQITGKKVAGVLIETDLSEQPNPMVLVGTGINVNFDPAEHADIRDIATSLSRETGREVNREELLASYLVSFERLYRRSRHGERVQLQWKSRLVTIGKHVRASWPGGEASGLAEDVDENGGLVVRIAGDATITVEAGDVTLRE